MLREMDLKDFTDGKFYSANDLAKLGCDDCSGCSACCRGMGVSLVLDPYDVYNLTRGLNTSFNEMVASGKIELNIIDGIVQPNMSMKEDNGCSFLDENGRCSIHLFRPGICRLFPLGRYYEDDSFKYILQTNECKKENRTKVKIKNFLGIDNLKNYEEYINDWHYFVRDIADGMAELMKEGKEQEAKKMNMLMLEQFFARPYNSDDFYKEYNNRRMGG